MALAVQANAQSPEIAVRGNGVEIANNDVSPSITDHTSFGSVNEATGSLIRTFTIANTGTGPLTLTGAPSFVSISGSSDFTLSQDAVSPVAAVNGTTTFQITFNPSSYGLKTATVTVANDDADEGAYSFAIEGTGAATVAGEIWRPRLIDGLRSWNAVASSSTGSKLVALAGSNKVYTSADSSSNWTARDSNRGWKAVASSADGVKLVAVVTNGQIYTSTDSGATWTARDSNREWSGVASSADGTNLAATVNGGFIYTSSDSGVTWTSQAGAGSRNWYSVACSSDGSKLVAAAYTNFIYTSTDFGVNWTARATSGKWWAVASSSDGTKLAACLYNGNIYTSGDSGVTWVARNSGRPWNSVASSSDGSILLAGTNGGKLYLSKDAGSSWTEHESDRAWRGVAMNNAGTSLIAVAYSGYVYTSNDIIQSGEISLSGNGVTIASGDATPDLSDHTAFGGVNYSGTPSIQRTFTLTNTGPGNLLLTGTAPNFVRFVSGSTDFTVTSQPAFSIGANSSTTFTITLDPTSIGLRTATFSIANEDLDEDPYTLIVSGEGHFRPSATTTAATNVGSRIVTGNGTVNPNGLETTYELECSTNVGFTGTTKSAPQVLPAGFASVPVSGELVDLKPNTLYYVRVLATNSLGTIASTATTFTTEYLAVTRKQFAASTGVVGNGELSTIYAGMINNSGRVLMQGRGLVGSGGVTSNNDNWLMTDTSGNTKVIARSGTTVAGGGSLSGSFTHYLLTDSGVTFLHDRISGTPASSDYAYFSSPEDSSSLDLVSREGDSLSPGPGYFVQHIGKPAVDAQNYIYFVGNVGGVANNLNSGVWYDDGASLQSLIRAGDDLTTATTDPAWLGSVSNVLAAGGDGCVVIAALQDNPQDLTQTTNRSKNIAIVSFKSNGEATIVARKGDSVPTTTAILTNFSGVSRNSLADHAYTATVAGTGVTPVNDQVLMAKLGTQPSLIAREGVTMIGGASIKSFGAYHITAKKHVIFLATLDGVSANVDRVLCRWSQAGGITVLAREGSPAVGTGVNYGSLQTLSVSDAGAVALLSGLSDGTDVVMRMKANDAQLTQVVRSGAGQTIRYQGTNYPVNALSLFAETVNSGGGGGGMGTAINDKGEVFVIVTATGVKHVGQVYY